MKKMPSRTVRDVYQIEAGRVVRDGGGHRAVCQGEQSVGSAARVIDLLAGLWREGSIAQKAGQFRHLWRQAASRRELDQELKRILAEGGVHWPYHFPRWSLHV
jgi:hypothetical protein